MLFWWKFVDGLINQDEQTFLICDNALLTAMQTTLERTCTGIEIQPPYSPFLNIVERVISALKAAIKAGYFTSCHSTKNT